jgi:hypothetical protein
MMPLAQALWDMRDAAPAPPASPPLAAGAAPDAAANPDLDPFPGPNPAAGQLGGAAGGVKAEAGDGQPEGAVPVAPALQANPGASAATDTGPEQSAADGQLPEAAAAVPGLKADPEASAPMAATPTEGGVGRQPHEAAPAAQAPAAGSQSSPRAAGKGAAGEGGPDEGAPDNAAGPRGGPRSPALKQGRTAPERACAAAPADGAASAAADAQEARDGGPRAKRRHGAGGDARAAQGSGRAGEEPAKEGCAGAGAPPTPLACEAAVASPAGGAAAGGGAPRCSDGGGPGATMDVDAARPAAACATARANAAETAGTAIEPAARPGPGPGDMELEPASKPVASESPAADHAADPVTGPDTGAEAGAAPGAAPPAGPAPAAAAAPAPDAGAATAAGAAPDAPPPPPAGGAGADAPAPDPAADPAPGPAPASPRPREPAGPPPSGAGAAAVVCAGCGQRRHLACVPDGARAAAAAGAAWYHSAACAGVAAGVAAEAAAGVRALGALPDGLPLGWQLIRGAAVSAPEARPGAACLTVAMRVRPCVVPAGDGVCHASKPTFKTVLMTEAACLMGSVCAALSHSAACACAERVRAEPELACKCLKGVGRRSALFRTRRCAGKKKARLAWYKPRSARVGTPQASGRAPGAQDLRGWAPRYDERARAALRSALFAARHALADSAGPLPDGRSGANLVPAALMGGAGGAGRALDLSGYHTAVLWAGSALAGAALVRPRRRHAQGLPQARPCPRSRRCGVAARAVHLRTSQQCASCCARAEQCGVRTEHVVRWACRRM